MDREAVRAYAGRAWTAAEWDQEHWAREFAARGPRATFEAAQALWIHMRRVRPEWPTDEDRREDLAHHVALKRAIDRAADAFGPAGR